MTEPFSQDPRVMGGRLCLAGTRATVRAVEALIEEGLDDEAITAELPVTVEQVGAVRERMGEVRQTWMLPIPSGHHGPGQHPGTTGLGPHT